MPSPAQALAATASFSLLLAALTVGLFFAGVFFLRTCGQPLSYGLAALGFVRPRVGFFGGIGLGFVFGLGAILAGGLLSAATAYALTSFGYSAESTVQGPFMDSLRSWVAENPAVAVPSIVFVVVLLGPACEEIAFRGGLFNGLRGLGRLLTGLASRGRGDGKGPFGRGGSASGFSAVLAAVLSSAFFALLHLEPVILPTIFCLALALCYLFHRTGSLLSSFVAHATFNSLATSVIVLSGFGLAPTMPT